MRSKPRPDCQGARPEAVLLTATNHSLSSITLSQRKQK